MLCHSIAQTKQGRCTGLILTTIGVFSIVPCHPIALPCSGRVCGVVRQCASGGQDTHMKGDTMRQRFAMLLGLVLCTILVLGISSSSQVMAADNVIKFGISTALSGPAAPW